MRISGIASGFDTEQIVNDLMKVERLPLDRIYQQKVKAEWQRDAYRSINTKIASFRDLAFNMQLQTPYLARTVTSTNDAVVSGQAGANAQTGTYNILVQKLAKSATAITTSGVEERLAQAGSQTFRIRSAELDAQGDPQEYIEITIEEGETITDFMDKINRNSDLGISVFYDEVGDAFAFQSLKTGSNAIIEFHPEDSNFANNVLGIHESKAGENAQFTINGLTTERDSNNFNVSGLTIELRQVSEEAVRLEVKQDTDAIVTDIKALVDKYNEIIVEIHGKLNEPTFRDFPPLTEEQKAEMTDKEIELWEEKAMSGLLRSDRILNDIVYEMRRAFGSVVGDTEGISTLHQIGITTGSWYEHGQLHVNESKLRAAVEQNPDHVMELFTKNDNENAANHGIARRLTTVLDNSLDRLSDKAGRASISHDSSNLSEKIRQYESQMAALEDRLVKREERFWNQFIAMETALQQMYAQSDWLYQQLGMLNG